LNIKKEKVMNKIARYLGLIIFGVLMSFIGIGNVKSGYAGESHQKLVIDFEESINDGDWSHWTANFVPSARKMYEDFVLNPENQKNNIGILACNKANVNMIKRIDNCYAPKFYELEPYFFSGDYETYLVGVNLQVNEPNEYFKNGENYKVVVLVKDRDTWYVGGESGATSEVLGNYVNNIQMRTDALGVGYGFIDCNNPPRTIVVRDRNGVIRTVAFNNFVKNVTQNEIGNLGFDADAIKAQALAAKMCGWWAAEGHYRENYGADIMYGDVAYVSGANITQSVNSACNSVSSYKMLSSGGKLFYAAYVAGSQNSSGEHSGRLRQNGAQYLATHSNYTWKKILHYYYDDSSYNNPNTRTIRIEQY
jgi:hypothetical protein